MRAIHLCQEKCLHTESGTLKHGWNFGCIFHCLLHILLLSLFTLPFERFVRHTCIHVRVCDCDMKRTCVAHESIYKIFDIICETRRRWIIMFLFRVCLYVSKQSLLLLCLRTIWYWRMRMWMWMWMWCACFHILSLCCLSIFLLLLFSFLYAEELFLPPWVKQNEAKQSIAKRTEPMFSIKMIYFSNFSIAQLAFFEHILHKNFLLILKSRRKTRVNFGKLYYTYFLKSINCNAFRFKFHCWLLCSPCMHPLLCLNKYLFINIYL